MATQKTYTATEIGLLADAFGKDLQTIQRWIKNNNPILTSDVAKEALSKFIKPKK